MFEIIEHSIIFIFYLICICMLIKCARDFRIIEKRLDVSINRLEAWVKWYESQKYDDNS